MKQVIMGTDIRL